MGSPGFILCHLDHLTDAGTIRIKRIGLRILG
jgi:hypothetical protein